MQADEWKEDNMESRNNRKSHPIILFFKTVKNVAYHFIQTGEFIMHSEFSELRLKICRKCDHLRKDVCRVCMCHMPTKTKFSAAECPLPKRDKKWKAQSKN